MLFSIKMVYKSRDSFNLDENDKVANIVGSSSKSGKYKRFWETWSGKQFPKTCRILGCSNDATDGSHVYVKQHQGDNVGFILPTCHSCNMDAKNRYPHFTFVKAINTIVVAIKAEDEWFE